MERMILLTFAFLLLSLGCGGTYEYDLREYQTTDKFNWNGQFRVETRPGLFWFMTDMHRVVLIGDDGRELEIRHAGQPRVFLELRPTRVEYTGTMTATQPADTRPAVEVIQIEPQS